MRLPARNGQRWGGNGPSWRSPGQVGLQIVSAGIKQRHFRRFCSWEAAPLAGTRYALYMSF